MIRPLTIVTFLMACGSGLYLYQTKHEAQVLDRTIEKTVRDTSVYREQSRLLAAKWTMLNDPEMLRRFADAYLTLKTISPSQFTSLADLDSRLPPVPPPMPPEGANEEATAPPAVPDPEPATPVSRETVPGMIVENPIQVPRPAAAAPVSARPAERKVAVGSRVAAAESAYRPTGVDLPSRWTNADAASRSADSAARPSAPEIMPSPRVVAANEARASEQRPNDPHLADRRAPQATEAHGAEARGTEARATLPQPRPATGAAATGHPAATASPVAAMHGNTSHLPAPSTNPSAAQSASGGSLLGMARGSLSLPVPRPTPVSVAQW